MTIWEVAKIVLILLAAAMVPIVAVEVDIARYRAWRWFRPADLYPSVIIMLSLLCCLAYLTQPWLLPCPWPGLVLPEAVIVWHFYSRRRLADQR